MKVYYFNAYGRAEAIRMLLSKAGVAFEDDRREFGEDWKNLKDSGKLEYGQGPAVELDDGTMLCQTNAILAFLAETHGFATKTPMQAYKCQHLISLFQEDYGKHQTKWWMASAEDKPKIMDEILGTHFPTFAGHVARKYDGSSKFLVADHLTTADFIVGGFFTNTVLNSANPNHEKWTEAYSKVPENLKTYVSNFQDEMKEYLSARPSCTM